MGGTATHLPAFAYVLSCFKKLHQTRKIVFNKDDYALTEARKRINEEFKKQKNEESAEKIQELLKIGTDTEFLLRTTVIQAKLNTEGNYEAQLTKDTEFFKNVPYKDG